MSFQITEMFITQFKNNVQLLLQQRGSKLRGKVMEDTFVGKAAKAVDQLGPVQARKRITRHADTPLISTPHSSRWIYPTDYEWADLIDQQDKVRTVEDPSSAYVINGAMAIGRGIDDEIINAFFHTAKSGEEGQDEVPFPSKQVVPVDLGAASATGLNVAKLRAAKKMLLKAEVDVDFEELYMGITAEQNDNLLSEIQATSRDFNPVPVLQDGKISQFMGFNFIHTERLHMDESGYRRNPCWAKSGVQLGNWAEFKADISERADKSYATQVYVCGTYGATRLEEGKVVEVKCSEV